MQFKLIFNHALLSAKKCSIATTFEVRLVKKVKQERAQGECLGTRSR